MRQARGREVLPGDGGTRVAAVTEGAGRDVARCLAAAGPELSSRSFFRVLLLDLTRIMPLPETMFCAQQIKIPPELPDILKQFTKAAIRTQPCDVLQWSAG
ncbi:ropporin-1-like protein [Alligator mississippiensis]|uniref:Ropporin-1-like protein n=1 Tax=Alligator mississippiensis TaxID=8496 RepID=A0A151PH52_ALLMI|nr:ropporin-1-like protein [Alligator mississippiensis]